MFRKLSLKTFVNFYKKPSKNLLQKIIFDKQAKEDALTSIFDQKSEAMLLKCEIIRKLQANVS